MNRLEIIDDFDEVKSIAKQIDDGVSCLDQKLSSVSRFGLSLHPEETRAKAEDLLKNISEEIDCMKCNVESCLDEQKQILMDTIADNNSIQDYIEKTRREVDELEEFFRTRKDYQPFVPDRPKENVSDKECMSFEAESLQNSFDGRGSLDSNATCLEYYGRTKTHTAVKESSTVYHNSSGNIDCTLDERVAPVNLHYRLSNILKPRILNIADDTLRTPGNLTSTKTIIGKFRDKQLY